MSVQSSVPASGRRRTAGLVLIAGAMVAVLAACGGGSANSPAAAPSSTDPGSGGPNTPPGAFGTAAAVSAASLEVQNQSTGQVTVNFGSSTKFSNSVSAALSDVTVGECAVVSGTAAGTGKVTATTVTVSPATSAGCSAGFGGFGGGGGGRTRPSGVPPTRSSGGNRSGGGANAGGRAFGTVSAVTGSTFTVHSTSRQSGSATDTAVTVDGTTKFTKTVSATSSALAVGECISALGQTDDTGAVTATSIAISQPGPNGCTQGFGGGRRGGAGGTTGTTNG